MVVTGIGGAFSVVAANSWMNQPQGFTLNAAGKVVDVEPLKVLFNPATGYEVPHMILAAYMVVGFLVASIYAVGMLKGRRDRLHRLGLVIPLTIACIATPIQLFVGDTAAREVADHQPAKFAAMECIEKTGADQTEYLGGICTDDGVKGAIGIPGLDSFLVGFSTDTEVTGLNSIPDDEEPPAHTMLHLAFDAMVGIGSALLALGAWFAFVWWRRREHAAHALVPARGRRLRGGGDRWRCGAAGSSPRSGGSRGSSRATCAPPKRSPRRRGSGSASPWCCSSTRASGPARSSSCARCPAAGARPGPRTCKVPTRPQSEEVA